MSDAAFRPKPARAPSAGVAEHVDSELVLVQRALRDGITLRQQLLDEQAPTIVAAAAAVVASLRRGGKLLLCGNGGSAADCQHIAAELVGRFGKHPRPGLPALALTTDTSALTAIANDFSYEQIFARQVEAHGRPEDVLIALSTSGRSPNVVRAAELGKARGLKVIALCGPQPGPLGAAADLCLCAPGLTSDRIQELHITVGHIICDIVDRAFLEPALGPAHAPSGRLS